VTRPTATADEGVWRLKVLELLRGAAARVVVIEECLEDGDTGMAFTVARDLELDLRAVIHEYAGTA
jgi:hypothetical protein